VPRALITGAGGQLGRDLRAVLADRAEDDVTALGRAELDLTDEAHVRSVVRTWARAAADRGRRPLLLNAAAYTAVDAAEDDEDTALLVNGAAPGWLAEELAGVGRLVHVSTDYVFDGTSSVPYTTADRPAPRTAYGRTKLAGERAVAAVGDDAVVVRTAWVYAAHGSNFVRTMLRLLDERPEVTVVDDQTGSPTYVGDLVGALLRIADAGVSAPVVHAANTGGASRFDQARAVYAAVGADLNLVRPVGSAAHPRPAPRPGYSVLGARLSQAAGLPPLRPWADALAHALSGS